MKIIMQEFFYFAIVGLSKMKKILDLNTVHCKYLTCGEGDLYIQQCDLIQPEV